MPLANAMLRTNPESIFGAPYHLFTFRQPYDLLGMNQHICHSARKHADFQNNQSMLTYHVQGWALGRKEKANKAGHSTVSTS